MDPRFIVYVCVYGEKIAEFNGSVRQIWSSIISWIKVLGPQL